MERTLAEFIEVLRGADVRVSPAEAIEGMQVAGLVGFESRHRLKQGLSLVLAKSHDEKLRFDRCFDDFFRFGVQEKPDESPRKQPMPEQPGEGGASSGGSGGGLSSALGVMLGTDNPGEEDLALARAAREVGLQNIRMFTQVGLYTARLMQAMGSEELDAEIAALESREPLGAQAWKDRREALRARARALVEQQMLLRAEARGRETAERVLPRINLSQLEQRHQQRMKELIRRIAKKLVAIHSRRRKKARRGQLDIRKTLRGNAAYGGHLFHLRWKARRIDRPKVFAICDISGSVASVSRFLMLFLYSVREVLPRVRVFVFCSKLGEVTDLFRAEEPEVALAEADRLYGIGGTDYGRALRDFEELALDDVDNRSTVIMLGDGRNNYGDPRSDIWQSIYRRARYTLWLNPEARANWQLGDSEMRRYAPYCTRAEVCATLRDLERVVSRLLDNIG
ncbi:MAG: VWA domain-containing protein [Acidobacteriota bacterium]|nr:VWA domain-containing protein [Acidobacteriota bacterium]